MPSRKTLARHARLDALPVEERAALVTRASARRCELRAAESSEQRRSRLNTKSERTAVRRSAICADESSAQRRNRLDALSERRATRRAAYTPEERAAKRAKRNACDRNRYAHKVVGAILVDLCERAVAHSKISNAPCRVAVRTRAKRASAKRAKRAFEDVVPARSRSKRLLALDAAHATEVADAEDSAQVSVADTTGATCVCAQRRPSNWWQIYTAQGVLVWQCDRCDAQWNW